MNTSTLESFISYCDTMMIAEESQKGLTALYEKVTDELKKVTEMIKKEDLLSKRISIYTKSISILTKLKSEVQNEKAITIRELPGILLSTIPSAIIGMLTVAGAKNYKREGKLHDARTTAVAGTALTGLGLFAVSGKCCDNLKEKKVSYLRAIDKAIDESKNIIQSYKVAISKGYKTIDQYDAMNSPFTDNKSSRERVTKTLSLIKPAGEQPENEKDAIKQMQNESVAFLKKYASSKEFKASYKPYLHMIDIYVSDYGDLFSITITDYQDGYDDDIEDPIIRENNNWYNELLTVGEGFIKHRFGKWELLKKHPVNIGDGDEGTIYV